MVCLIPIFIFYSFFSCMLYTFRLVVEVNFGIEIVCVVYAYNFIQSSENKYPVDFHWQKSKLSILLDDDDDKARKKTTTKKRHMLRHASDERIKRQKMILSLPFVASTKARTNLPSFSEIVTFSLPIFRCTLFDLLLILLSLATFVIPIRLSFPSSHGNL